MSRFESRNCRLCFKQMTVQKQSKRTTCARCERVYASPETLEMLEMMLIEFEGKLRTSKQATSGFSEQQSNYLNGREAEAESTIERLQELIATCKGMAI